jgi:hypothetical protein
VAQLGAIADHVHSKYIARARHLPDEMIDWTVLRVELKSCSV